MCLTNEYCRYDKILVMDAGVAAEYDDPLTLFDEKDIFYAMCEKSGIVREDIIMQRGLRG